MQGFFLAGILELGTQNAFDGYWELFVSAFISSTVLPGGSEALLAYLVSTRNFDIGGLLFAATSGNTLGAMTTWALGIMAAKKFPLATLLSTENQKALAVVKTKGLWALFFSWLPIIGDAFCFAGGWLKLPLFPAFLVILLGKLFRYLVVAGLFV